MHILINGWFWGQETNGSGQYLRYLVEQLPRLFSPDECQLTLVIPHAQVASKPIVYPANVTPYSVHLPKLPSQLAKVWWEQITMPNIARKKQVDLLWVPYWAAPYWQPVPTVVTIHDLIPQLLPAYRGGRLQKIYTALVASTARRADAIITVSDAGKRDVVQHLQVDPAKVHAVLSGPNTSVADPAADLAADLAADSPGVSEGDTRQKVSIQPPSAEPVEARLSLRQAQGATERLRQKYALPQRYFLYLGGYDARKNVESVVRGYKAYLTRGGDSSIKLVVAGRLPKRYSDFFPDPQTLVHQLDLEEQVAFCGFVDEADKPMLYQLSIGYLFPSLYEGFGMTIIEAMNAGTPVITSRV